MKDFSAKKAVLASVASLAALMMLVGLYIPLGFSTDGLGGHYDGIYMLYYFNYYIFSAESQILRFMAMGFECYMQLLCSIVLVTVNIVGIFCFSRKTSGRIALISVLIAIVFSCAYMFEGLFFGRDIKGNRILTYSYLLPIITAVIAAAFLICKFAIKEKNVPAETVNSLDAETKKEEETSSSEN